MVRKSSTRQSVTVYLQTKTLFSNLIPFQPSPNLGMSVVIPTHDEPQLLLSLMSLRKCTLPKCDVEVIVVINDSEKSSEVIKAHNQSTYEQVLKWAEKMNRSNRLKFIPLYCKDLPRKHAGVGLARKIGMDEACWRFEHIHNDRGILLCFDADSRCDENYFLAVEEAFNTDSRRQACSIYFEHPIEGAEYEEEVYQAILQYELHLRYFINAQRWANFPFAFQTVGSSMAVRCDAYQAQGGMNRRQAGEDFYFLHKFIELGSGFFEVNSTRVIPSPRPSRRVPFGTGKAVDEMIRCREKLLTYAPASFEDLKCFFQLIQNAAESAEKWKNVVKPKIPESIRSFLETQDFECKMEEIGQHTSSAKTFQNRFFRWFNAFLLMKYLHHARALYYPDVQVQEAAKYLLKQWNITPPDQIRDMLLLFRARDRQGWKSTD